MANEALVGWLGEMQVMFERTSSALVEGDSDFAPAEGMYTAAQLVGHVAMTVDWFVDGGLAGKPFDLDFEEADRQVRTVHSLGEARKMLKAAFQRAKEKTASLSEAQLNEPLPEGPILGGAPRSTVFGALCDHTAHHRGVLAVYTRLLGKVPPMPYGEPE